MPSVCIQQCLTIDAGFDFSFLENQMNKLLTALLAGFFCVGAFAQTAAPAAPVAPAVQSAPVTALAPTMEIKKQKATTHKSKKSKRKAKKAAKQ